MKAFYIGLILLTSFRLCSQNLEIIGGINVNNFFDFEDDVRSNSSYNIGYGYTARIAIDDIKTDALSLRFALGFEKYSGELSAIIGGLGGRAENIASIDKTVVSLGVYPLNFSIKNSIDLSFGFEVSALVGEQFMGTHRSFNMMQGEIIEDLNEVYDSFSSNFYFGLRGRIAYDIHLSDKWVLSPQYAFLWGLTEEFEELPTYTRSMRHLFAIGIQRRLNLKRE